MRKVKVSPYVFPGLEKKELNHHEVNFIVSKHFEVPFDDLFLRCRKREIVDARKAGMYIMRKYTTKTLKDIADAYNLNHATASYASTKSVPNLIDTDWEYRMKMEKCEKEVERNFDAKPDPRWDNGYKTDKKYNAL